MGEDAAFDYLKNAAPQHHPVHPQRQAQAQDVAKGEVGIGVSFIFGFDNVRHAGFDGQDRGALRRHGYEIGGIALVKGSRNRDAAKRYYDWLMSPAGQSLGAKANSLQVPANKTFKPDPRSRPSTASASSSTTSRSTARPPSASA